MYHIARNRLNLLHNLVLFPPLCIVWESLSVWLLLRLLWTGAVHNYCHWLMRFSILVYSGRVHFSDFYFPPPLFEAGSSGLQSIKTCGCVSQWLKSAKLLDFPAWQRSFCCRCTATAFFPSRIWETGFPFAEAWSHPANSRKMGYITWFAFGDYNFWYLLSQLVLNGLFSSNGTFQVCVECSQHVSSWCFAFLSGRFLHRFVFNKHIIFLPFQIALPGFSFQWVMD